MLRMTKLADYGTVVTTAMARDPDAVHSATGIAAATGISMPTVSKVMKLLTRGGIVLSLRGANGGYLLPRPPQRITLAQVIIAIDGPIGITECSTLPGLCSQEAACTVRANWMKVNGVIYEALQQITLADMAGPTLRAVDISAIRARSLSGQRRGSMPVARKTIDGGYA
ncbi:SUF system Fe-S cluster assembly regulator [Paraburkholderia dipogonis]|uniref:SUF system Fe-S cluster assembly regulator n=1 Tax=Paraburkholderia dipogonis TaxID=1211383 RepID=A0A4Y8MG71_9BURK|nr:SUF system Fe-S cluster assembly regulator [Paraburkholderia dipogonis]TFE36452.1 SUF system Fe-S cluster assembly regulator [Paraburkholderia dipogonis]